MRQAILLPQIEGDSFLGTAVTMSDFSSPSRSLHIRLRDGKKISGFGPAIPENELPPISKLSLHTKCTVRTYYSTRALILSSYKNTLSRFSETSHFKLHN
jgi:hypothetical protein